MEYPSEALVRALDRAVERETFSAETFRESLAEVEVPHDRPSPAEVLGSSTDAVLRELLDLDGTELQKLRRDGVVGNDAV